MRRSQGCGGSHHIDRCLSHHISLQSHAGKSGAQSPPLPPPQAFEGMTCVESRSAGGFQLEVRLFESLPLMDALIGKCFVPQDLIGGAISLPLAGTKVSLHLTAKFLVAAPQPPPPAAPPPPSSGVLVAVSVAGSSASHPSAPPPPLSLVPLPAGLPSSGVLAEASGCSAMPQAGGALPYQALSTSAPCSSGVLGLSQEGGLARGSLPRRP